jgi:hypothetical protein
MDIAEAALDQIRLDRGLDSLTCCKSLVAGPANSQSADEGPTEKSRSRVGSWPGADRTLGIRYSGIPIRPVGRRPGSKMKCLSF